MTRTTTQVDDPTIEILVLKSRPPRRWGVLLFLGVSLVLLVLVWVLAFYQKEFNPQFLYNLSMWLFGVVVVVITLFAEIFRVEKVTLAAHSLRVASDFCGWTKTRAYDLQALDEVTLLGDGYWEGSTYVVPQGKLRFNYLGKKVEIGAGLSRQDAQQLLFRINERRDQLVRGL